MSEKRYETCVKCGETYNVSQKAYVPKSGYECPKCAMQRIRLERMGIYERK